VKTKLAAVAFSALAIGGIGMGVAHAAGAPSTPSGSPSVNQSAPTGTEAPDAGGVDSGPNVQQGSQTAPDTKSGPETTSTEAPDPGGVDSGPNVQQGSQSGPDTPGTG
jgi:hypothetical protein